MKTVCVANEKGGVGKTALAANLVWHFAARDYRVLAIDLDQQANLTSALAELVKGRGVEGLFEGLPAVNGVVDRVVLSGSSTEISGVDRGDEAIVIPAFHHALEAVSERFDVAVIDTPPALHTLRTIAALSIADAVVAPIEVSDFALQGVHHLQGTLAEVAAAFHRTPVRLLGLLIWKFHRASPRERQLFRLLQDSLGDIIIPGQIAKRDAHARALSEHKPVWEMTGTAAREAASEIRPVLTEIEHRLMAG